MNVPQLLVIMEELVEQETIPTLVNALQDIQDSNVKLVS
jgi:hypothetical protein